MTFRIDRMSMDEAQAIAGKNGPRLKFRLDKAFTKIEEAQDSLSSQLNTIEANQRLLNIGLSWTTPSDVLTASDAGSSASITIATHTRVYASGGQSTVAGHTFTGLAYTTTYGIYYDDESLSDPTPVYQITTNIKTAQHNYENGRIMVGTITTPAAAAPPVTGGNFPPGYRGNPIP